LQRALTGRKATTFVRRCLFFAALENATSPENATSFIVDTERVTSDEEVVEEFLLREGNGLMTPRDYLSVNNRMVNTRI
jgi:hypothetical protein